MKTLFKEFIKDLWETRTRFLSILLIVALGCGFYAGVKVTGDDMKLTMDKYLFDTNFWDIKVTSKFGISENDLKSIEKIENVKEVIPGFQYDVLLKASEANPVIRVHSFNKDVDKNISQFELIEGRLPEKPGECLVEDIRFIDGSVLEGEFEIGQKIKILPGNDDIDFFDFLKRDEYEIVGKITSPLYFVTSLIETKTNIGAGSVSSYMYVWEENFSMEVYTAAFVNVIDAEKLNTFSMEFEEITDKQIDNIEKISDIREPIRFKEVKREPEEKIEDAKIKLEDGKIEGQEKIDDATKKIKDAEEKLIDGQKEYSDGLDTFNTEISDAEKKLAEAKKDLDEGQEEYKDGLKKYNDAFSEYWEIRREAEIQIASAETQLGAAEKLLRESEIELANAKNQLDLGQQELDNKQNDINNGYQQIQQVYNASNGINSALSNISTLTQTEIDEIKVYVDFTTYPDIDGPLSVVVQDYYDKSKSGQPTWFHEMILQGVKNGLETEYNANKIVLDAGQSEINTAQNTLNSLKKEYEEGYKKYLEGEAEYSSGLFQLSESKKELLKGEETLNEAKEELDDAKKKLDDGRKEYEDGQNKLEENRVKGEKELLDAKIKIEDGKKEIEDGKEELKKAEEEFESEITENEQKILDAEKEIENLSQAEWEIVSRQNYQSIYDFGENANRIDSISKIFPVFFFAIAALVSLTTMTRMVDEQRTQIGTLKSLGYFEAAIIIKFLAYAVLASILGAAIGLLFGVKVFPALIYGAYSALLYRTPPIINPYPPELLISTTIIATTCVTIATLYASVKTVRNEPAELLRPVAPPSGKRIFLERITFIWKRLTFSQKVTMRNLFRYKKRMLMSIIGIAGCTSLLLAGFGLRDAIMDIAEKQFSTVTIYDATVVVDKEKTTKKDLEEITEHLDSNDEITDYYFASFKNGVANSTNRLKKDNVFVISVNENDYDEFGNFIKTSYKGEKMKIPKEGIIISTKLASLHSKKIGDTISIKVDDVKKDVEIVSYMENYAGHYAIMNDQFYEKTFNQRSQLSSVLLQFDGNADAQKEKEISEDIIKIDNVITVNLMSDMYESMDSQMRSLNTIVLVLIISSGLLAFIVMYNLTNINITEREREIATLKVLGFYPKETSSYIFRENILLSIIATIVGLLAGVFLTGFIVRSAEVDEIVFLKTIKPLSYVFAFALSMFFTFIVRLVMTRRLDKIDMIESLKSVE